MSASRRLKTFRVLWVYERATFRPPRGLTFWGVILGAKRTLAAGWVTSISRRMALPSLVSTIPESIGETRGRSGTGQRRVLLGTGDLEKVFCLGAIGPVCPNAGGDRGADRAGRAPPEASRIILSMERGPSVVRMMSATACWDGSRRTGGRGSVAGLRSSPSGKMVLWRLAPNARGGFDRRSGWWVCDVRDETHLGGGDVVQLRFATGLTLGVGVWMGRGGAIGQSRWWAGGWEKASFESVSPGGGADLERSSTHSSP